MPYVNEIDQVQVPLQFSAVSNPPVQPVNRDTGLPPSFFRTQDIAIPIGIFDINNVAIDLTNLVYLQFTLKASQSALTPLVVKTISASDITKSINYQDWLDGTAEQATIILTAADTDQGLQAEPSLDFWIVLQGLTTTGSRLSYGAGVLTIFDPGATIPAATAATVDYHEQTNDSGDSNILPTAIVFTEQIDFTGAARTSNVIVSTASTTKGAKVFFTATFPAVAGIQVNIYNSSLLGALLAGFLTDGYTLSGFFCFTFDGTEWVKTQAAVPAY